MFEDEDLELIALMSRRRGTRFDTSPPRENKDALTTNMVNPDRTIIRPDQKPTGG